MAVNLTSRGVLALKGMAMGAADVVPGVSGGTIAFIAGIYEELIRSLQSINLASLRKLFKDGVPAFWDHINGGFLLPLFLGIGISIVSLAKGITYLLANHPELLWSFFFGLILASILVVGKTVRRWNAGVFVGLAIGTAVAAAFLAWLPMQQIMMVMGKGSIPTFAPPWVPVGPVIAGDNIATPGHLSV